MHLFPGVVSADRDLGTMVVFFVDHTVSVTLRAGVSFHQVSRSNQPTFAFPALHPFVALLERKALMPCTIDINHDKYQH